jgi:protocatechuate 3,4-dioxygenase beta subunit
MSKSQSRSIAEASEFLMGSETLNRRVVLASSATVAAAGFAANRLVGLAQESGDPLDEVEIAPVCMLVAEMTEGPYYLEGDLVRRDITEGKPGVPLLIKINVQDATACGPLANAAVDIWHCDAQGYYSGVASNNPGPDTDQSVANEVATQVFLRGVQMTDEEGNAEFVTIYPGWYTGRTVHIHMKVYVGGDAQEEYIGGNTAHVGQLFFDDAISDQVYSTAEAYGGRDNSQRTRNDSDNILGDHADEPGFMLTLMPITEGSLDDGFIGTISLGVDPGAISNESGGGGGGQGGGRPGDGQGQPPSN